jgi:N-acetylglutamate synthase-like GNAT family acetyltransferase
MPTLSKASPMADRGMIDVSTLQDKFPIVDFSLSQRGDKATLIKVVVPENMREQGIGTEFMNALTQAADNDAAKLALSPSSDFGGNKTRLVDFYKEFGFIPNKGRKADLSVSESMIRTPISNVGNERLLKILERNGQKP